MPYSSRNISSFYRTRTPQSNFLYSPSRQKINKVTRIMSPKSRNVQNFYSVPNIARPISPINNYRTVRYMTSTNNIKKMYKIYTETSNSMKNILPYQKETIVHQPIIKVENYSHHLKPITINNFNNFENVTQYDNLIQKPDFNYNTYNNFFTHPKPTLKTPSKPEIIIEDYSNYNNYNNNYNDYNTYNNDYNNDYNNYNGYNNVYTNYNTIYNTISNNYDSNYNNNYNFNTIYTNSNYNTIYNNFNNHNYDFTNNYLEPPENFDPNEFELTQLIGIGGFSEIFACKWKLNGKKYVMKRLVSQEIDDIKNERMQAKVVMNFIRNTGSDGVIKIYGENIIPSSNTQCILMEYAENDWENEITKRKMTYTYYSENELMNIMNQLIRTLSLLENFNITHRDIKPKNILIAKGKYKISDFSDSKVIPEGRTKLLVRGTELYMSPLLLKAFRENNMVVHDSYKSDVYSFGMCFLYAASLGSQLMDDVRNINDDGRRMSYLMSGLGYRYSTKFVNLLCCMLQPDERKRPYFTQLETMIY